jgi:hypothetical protein
MINENLLSAEQRTEQWYQDRSGKFTGSRFKDLLATDKHGKPLKAYHDLIIQIVGERLTGRYQESGMDSYALRHGREVEPYAREEYELQTGLIVAQASFIQHPTYKFVGASPDGLVTEDGGVEIKCPKDWDIHLARFEFGMEDEHMPQVQGCMWVTKRKWWDFVSYDPRVNEHLRFYRQRVWRDDAYIAQLDRAVMLAEHEVRERLKNYTPERVTQILIDRVKEPIA